MKARKLTTLALTGALALGGLGIGSMADLPIPGLQATQADAATMSDISGGQINYIYTSTANAIGVSTSFDTFVGHYMGNVQTRFIIKNSVGTVVKQGTLNLMLDGGDGSEWGSLTNISLAGLPKNSNHYRVDVVLVADDGNVGPTQYSGLTKAFTYNADGSVTNVRP